MSNRPSPKITRKRGVVQIFRSEADYFAGVSFIVGSYGRILSGQLTASLYEVRADWDLVRLRGSVWRPPTSLPERLRRLLTAVLARFPVRHRPERALAGQGTPIAATTIDCGCVYDNSSVELFVRPVPVSAGRLYLLHITSTCTSRNDAPSAWLSDEHERIPGHVWCAAAGIDQGRHGVKASVIHANPQAPTQIPEGLLISTTTQCNLNCIHCISRPTRTSVQRLSADIRREIAGWCRDGKVRALCSDYSGDLLWSDHRFGDDLDFFLGLDTPYHLDTNGVCLTDANAERLLRSRVRSINVSLDAGTDETYRRVRRGAPPLQTVVENARRLADLRARFGRQDLPLSFSFTLMRSTLDELGALIGLAHRVGFGAVYGRHLEVYTRDLLNESLWFDRERYNAARQAGIALGERLGVGVWLPPAFEPRPERAGHKMCLEPWRSAVILGNGDVRACCVPGPSTWMGNLHTESMEQIWNGPRYQQFRLRVNSANPPDACARCPMFRHENNRGSYLVCGD